MKNSIPVCAVSVALLFAGCGGGGSSTPVAGANPVTTVNTPSAGSSTTPNVAPLPETSTGTVAQPATPNPVPANPIANAALGLPFSFNARSLDLIGGNLVSISSSGIKAVSSDGSSWAVTSTTTGIGQDAFNSTYAINGKFYGATTSQGIYESVSGSSWSKVTGGVSDVKSIATNSGGLYVSVGYPTAQNPSSIASSQDGTVWTSVVGGASTVKWNGVAFANNKFVAVGDGGATSVSADGKIWAPAAIVPIPAGFPNSINLQAVAWASFASKFIAVGNFSRMYTSPDGAVWTEIPSATVNGPGSNVLKVVCFSTRCIGGSDFQTGGRAGLFTTTDAALNTAFSWWAYGLNENQKITFGIATIGSKAIAVGNAGGLQTSDNAINWTEIATR